MEFFLAKESHLKYEKDTMQRRFYTASFEDERDHMSKNVGATGAKSGWKLTTSKETETLVL